MGTSQWLVEGRDGVVFHSELVSTNLECNRSEKTRKLPVVLGTGKLYLVLKRQYARCAQERFQEALGFRKVSLVDAVDGIKIGVFHAAFVSHQLKPVPIKAELRFSPSNVGDLNIVDVFVLNVVHFPLWEHGYIKTVRLYCLVKLQALHISYFGDKVFRHLVAFVAVLSVLGEVGADLWLRKTKYSLFNLWPVDGTFTS